MSEECRNILISNEKPQSVKAYFNHPKSSDNKYEARFSELLSMLSGEAHVVGRLLIDRLGETTASEEDSQEEAEEEEKK